MSRRCSTIRYFSRLLPLALALLCSVVAVEAEAQLVGPIAIEVGWTLAPEFGAEVDVPILLHNDIVGPALGGFNLLLHYDTTGLTFNGAVAGNLLEGCGWEYFNYSQMGDNLIRLVAVANIADTPGEPSCFLQTAGSDTLAELFFTVASDTNYRCTAFPVEFIWLECGDNALSDQSGDTLLISDRVFLSSGMEAETGASLPSLTGAPDSCIANLPGPYIRAINYFSNSVDTDCLADPAAPGDVSLNWIPFEQGDWWLFSRYFLEGYHVFDLRPERQIGATEVNNDGAQLTLRDLAYFWRVRYANADPDPAPVAIESPDTAVFVQNVGARQISFTYPDSLVHIVLVFDGDVVVSSTDSLVFVDQHQTLGATRALLYPFAHPMLPDRCKGIHAGTILSYTGEGRLVGAEVADWQDYTINTRIESTGGTSDCGDADGNSVVNIGDCVAMVQYIFAGGPAPDPIGDGDVDCDGTVNISDAVYLLQFIFGGGAPPCGNCP